MKIVIVGCGRVGAVLAEAFDGLGHEVVILDVSTRAFERLSEEFRGSAVRADGTDEEALRRAGAAGADVFLALTEGDNRNVMAAQIAVENLGVEQVVAKINDPVRAAAYAELGIATVCRTTMLAESIQAFLGFGPTGVPSVIAATGRHDAGAPHPRSGTGSNAAAAWTGLGAAAGTAGSAGAGVVPGRAGTREG